MLWLNILSTAPTSCPVNVTAGIVTAKRFTVFWEEVPCLHRNGEINGYTVVARALGEADRVNVSDGGNREATFSGVTPNIQYTVYVAAVNSAGTGPNNSVLVDTPGECGVIEISYIYTLYWHSLELLSNKNWCTFVNTYMTWVLVLALKMNDSSLFASWT